MNQRTLLECSRKQFSNSFPYGSLSTTKLINMRLSTTISEFLCRVQAVTWNRTLIRTESLGLEIAPKYAEVGDLFCVLYGCSVPAILKRKVKEHFGAEEAAYEREIYKAAIWIQKRWKILHPKVAGMPLSML
jgi:hypothetical protein